MNTMYKCSICGAEYNNVEDYMKCVKQCGEDMIAYENEEKERKKQEEINAALNKVKSAKSYYEECLKDFQANYPEAYELNFGSMCKCGSDNKCKEKKEHKEVRPTTVKVNAKKEKDKDPEVKMKVNGKDVSSDNIYSDLRKDDYVDILCNILGL